MSRFSDWFVELNGAPEGKGQTSPPASPKRRYFALKGKLENMDTTDDSFDTTALHNGWVTVTVFPLIFSSAEKSIETKILSWPLFNAPKNS